MNKLLIRECAIENLNKKVVLTLKKKQCENSFTREVTIVKVLTNCLICKGLSGMEWPYPIDDSEMEILNIETV